MAYQLTADLLTGNALIDQEHKQLIQAIPGNLKKIPLPFVLFQEKRAAIQTTAFQTVFVVAPIKDMQPATGAVKKNMATLL